MTSLHLSLAGAPHCALMSKSKPAEFVAGRRLCSEERKINCVRGLLIVGALVPVLGSRIISFGKKGSQLGDVVLQINKWPYSFIVLVLGEGVEESRLCDLAFLGFHERLSSVWCPLRRKCPGITGRSFSSRLRGLLPGTQVQDA